MVSYIELKGELHRIDGPAKEYEYANGVKEWYQDGELHRIDGPAKEYATGAKSGIKIKMVVTSNIWSCIKMEKEH